MTAPAPTGAGPRIVTIDAVRGVAVMGILLMNIVDFALPAAAHFDPGVHGADAAANWWAWALAYALVSGKMRALFSLLFGASMVLIAERTLATGGDPLRRHVARMAALLAIGMAHAWLIWWGDILVAYALCGALAFLFWRKPPHVLFVVAGLLMAGSLASGLLDIDAARRFGTAASAPDADPAMRERWRAWRDAGRSPEQIAAEIAAYRGGWPAVQAARARDAARMQAGLGPAAIAETVSLMLAGMALFRLGFFSGAWRGAAYRRTLLLGYGIALPLYVPLIAAIDRSGFAPLTIAWAERVQVALLGPPVALAHAALVILLVRGRHGWLSAHVAAAGRTALTNYLGASIVCTAIFYGYGLGWFARIERWQLYPLALLLCAAMLAWPVVWLGRYRVGPAEWLWRSLATLRRQPMRRS